MAIGDRAIALTGDLARIEVALNEIDRLFHNSIRAAIVTRFKDGVNCISLDLQGFRSGSLNEASQQQ